MGAFSQPVPVSPACPAGQVADEYGDCVPDSTQAAGTQNTTPSSAPADPQAGAASTFTPAPSPRSPHFAGIIAQGLSTAATAYFYFKLGNTSGNLANFTLDFDSVAVAAVVAPIAEGCSFLRQDPYPGNWIGPVLNLGLGGLTLYKLHSLTSPSTDTTQGVERNYVYGSETGTAGKYDLLVKALQGLVVANMVFSGARLIWSPKARDPQQALKLSVSPFVVAQKENISGGIQLNGRF